jgi:hypothetical protein
MDVFGNFGLVFGVLDSEEGHNVFQRARSNHQMDIDGVQKDRTLYMYPVGVGSSPETYYSVGPQSL